MYQKCLPNELSNLGSLKDGVLSVFDSTPFTFVRQPPNIADPRLTEPGIQTYDARGLFWRAGRGHRDVESFRSTLSDAKHGQ
jgi:hypothetical protein